MKKVLAAAAASSLLVAGGFVASAVSPAGEAAAQVAEDQEAEDVRLGPGSVLGSVLDELIADGTITADQAETIRAKLQERHESLHEGFRDRMRERAERFGIDEMLADGVIDAAELETLPEDHPLRDPDGPAAEYLDDGQLTVEELRELRASVGRAGRHHQRWHGGAAPSAEESVES